MFNPDIALRQDHLPISNMSLGFHVSKTRKKRVCEMPVALKEDMQLLADYGFKPCAQIFVSGPQGFKETLKEADKLAIAALTCNGLKLVIHGAYVDNPWSMNNASIANIRTELKIAARIGATGVIIHLAAKALIEENLKYVIEGITKDACPEVMEALPILWLEINAAKSSPATYETGEKIIALFDRVYKCNTHQAKIGLCIDTAHLFSCGTNLSTYQAAAEWFSYIPQDLMDLGLVMLHLNDSASKCGSGIDRHEQLAVGNIWADYNPTTGHLPFKDSGLAYILNWAESNNIVTILERYEDGIKGDLTLIYSMGFFKN